MVAIIFYRYQTTFIVLLSLHSFNPNLRKIFGGGYYRIRGSRAIRLPLMMKNKDLNRGLITRFVFHQALISFCKRRLPGFALTHRSGRCRYLIHMKWRPEFLSIQKRFVLISHGTI